ncbi:glutamine synthetase beta-grasp domain-containing protein (plasmid) [Pontibacillus sp. ALD_SL1]|uniref:glutamine synthetase beta-grasp domain-containing protein n=1 Tax=Pontibacillus sp. ALD_SL1 TaxID=2777185 RepID=UPI001A9781E8|nr:glutamine synthetase beta-grasp domain-containing protein [Pontibacillus sp. ALD_SL1]QST02306.1 glutamine synthetase beta-grasp domain-containing protein [Pontibacillus sp. ALD_SL1]
MTPKEKVLEAVKDGWVEFIRLQFTDLYGNLKNIEVPVNQIQKVLDNEIMFDGSSIDGFTSIDCSDLYLVPDLSTWAVFPRSMEGEARVGRFICDIYQPNGEPFSGDPRYILKKNLEKMRDFQCQFVVGPEPEFFLFERLC